MNNLIKYGANDRFFTEAKLYPELKLARIISEYKNLYKIVTDKDTGLAEISGKFRHEAKTLSDYPAVGDFVMVDRAEMSRGNAIIHKVLTRKSLLSRTAVGEKNESQVIAANVDLLFICMSLNNDYSLNRIERYVSAAWDSGAIPVIVLTKSDLTDDLQSAILEIENIAIGVEVIATSKYNADSNERLKELLKPGTTASFIGSSGVGKSTLINSLAGEEIIKTSEIREGDDKGKHTTTRREMFVLNGGGIVIDTPGMREFGIQSADLSTSFEDIETLAENCKFSDCSHKSEPGCAVKAAIENGSLDRRRFESYKKLEKEAGYEGLTSKEIESKKLNNMFSEIGGMKNARKYLKSKDKRNK